MSHIVFSDELRDYGEPYWQAAVDHIFVREMVSGQLNLDAFRHYLIQDYAFFRYFTDLIAHAIVHAEEMQQRHHLAGFLGVLTDDENDYFLRSFAALDVEESLYLNPTLNPVMQQFAEVIAQASRQGYHDCLVVLLCAEWVYWTWADTYRNHCPDDFYFKEWLLLHNNSEFEKMVMWLRVEADRLGQLNAAEQERLKTIFRTCCQLEEAFFTYAYQSQD